MGCWKRMLDLSSPVKFSAVRGCSQTLLTKRKLLTRLQFALESWHDCLGSLVRELLAGGGDPWPGVQPLMWPVSAGSTCWQGYQQCTWRRTKLPGPHPAKICPSTSNPCAQGDASLLKTRSIPKIFLTSSAIHTVFLIGYALFLKNKTKKKNQNGKVLMFSHVFKHYWKYRPFLFFFFLWKSVAIFFNIQKLKVLKTSLWSMVVSLNYLYYFFSYSVHSVVCHNSLVDRNP